jgi:hypothetical protein
MTARVAHLQERTFMRRNSQPTTYETGNENVHFNFRIVPLQNPTLGVLVDEGGNSYDGKQGSDPQKPRC